MADALEQRVKQLRHEYALQKDGEMMMNQRMIERLEHTIEMKEAELFRMQKESVDLLSRIDEVAKQRESMDAENQKLRRLLEKRNILTEKALKDTKRRLEESEKKRTAHLTQYNDVVSALKKENSDLVERAQRADERVGQVEEILVKEQATRDYTVRAHALQNDRLQELKTFLNLSLNSTDSRVGRSSGSSWVEQPSEGAQAVEDEKMLKHIDGWRGRIMRYNSDSGFIYIQMQRCDYSLENWLERNKDQNSRSLPLMKSWFKQVVSAVKHIHKMNLIHRDLKPANILFVKDSILKVCDLGFSAETNEKDIPMDRTCGGCDLYASPEQTGQHNTLDCDNTRPKYNSKTDVFSLGMIFAEIRDRTNSEAPKSQATTKSNIYFDTWQKLADMVFKDLRRGRRSASIQDETVADFIAKLTKDKPDDRPTCAEILEDSFFIVHKDNSNRSSVNHLDKVGEV
ncbi:hypothetical protein PRIPAC_87310 [Pristionchus pacificus]|uniref:Protein kinase domain-containing protein n=1 Tax=Pristionchus pacificus TaxID=54126 RepID=A0A2A6CVZ2_PRIPA|nr:hypothetical protein PRIPAC_87310 [Pristionchus pacificus]|eukprot:PDM82217.1 protein kinase [Pristionchus pacificus]